MAQVMAMVGKRMAHLVVIMEMGMPQAVEQHPMARAKAQEWPPDMAAVAQMMAEVLVVAQGRLVRVTVINP